jgi:hypothetical protein
MMELASGESASDTNSQDLEQEYLAEIMNNKKEMKKVLQ